MKRAHEALESVPGVRTVEVSLDQKQAAVSFDSGKASAEDCVAALEEAGFGAERKGSAN